MNRIYAVIWNATLGMWTAVAETARRHGKRTMVAAGVAGTLLTAGLFASGSALGQAAPSVTVSSGKTNAYVSGNGVTVVNIDTPNAAGLSHNRYHSYNVNPSGLVLNNAAPSQMARQSLLAGQVLANMNLGTGTARVILNEVVSNNRSTLAGFTEVLGGRADVILANPYGITCSGCGFINTDRVTLTTGMPFINADGTLGAFSVGSGDILVNGGGLNATAQQVLDLVTRSVRLDGPVHGVDVGITAGANRWNYGTRSVTGAATASGTVAGYSIDSSALGGMYANRIRLTSTEAGVGVRMLADAAATADDFTLSAAGQVLVQARVSAQRDLAIETSSTSAQAVALADASLTAGGDLALRATRGGVTLAGGALVAGADLSVSAGSLVDSAGAATQPDANRRHAAGSLLIASSGAATLADTTWDTAGSWSGGFGSLAVGAGSRLAAGDAMSLTTQADLISTGIVTAGSGDLALRIGGMLDNAGVVHAGNRLDVADASGGGTQAVSNRGYLLAGGEVSIRGAALTNAPAALIQAGSSSSITVSSLQNGGTLLSAGDLHVTASGALNNTGAGSRMQAAGQLTVDGGSVANQGTLRSGTLLLRAGAGMANAGTGTIDADGGATLRVGGVLANSGTVHAGTTLDIADDAGAGTQAITNSGRLLAGQDLVLQAASIGNAAGGWIQASTRTAVNAGALSNAGTWLLSQQGGDRDSITVGGTLANAGRMQAAGDLAVSTNRIDNTGVVLANGAVAGTATGGLTNAAAATIQAGEGLTLSTVRGLLDNRGTIRGADVQLSAGAGLDNAGVIGAATRAVILRVDGAFNNMATGQIYAATALDIADRAGSGSADVANSGVLWSDGTLALRGDAVTNAAAGWIEAADGSTVTATALTNAGSWLLSQAQGATSQVSAGTSLTNSGRMQAGTLSGAGAVLTTGSVTLTAQNLSNSGAVFATAQLEADAAVLTNAGSMQGVQALDVAASGSLTNQASGTLLGNQLAVDAGILTNAGTIQAGTGHGSVSAGQAMNSGQVQSLGELALEIGSGGLSGAGDVLANGNLDVRARNGATYTASIGGDLKTGGRLTVTGNANSGLVLEAGADAAGNAVSMQIGRVQLKNGSSTDATLLTSQQDMTLNLSRLEMDGAYSRIVAMTGGAGAGEATITLGEALANNGLILSHANLGLTAPSITNGASGSIAALDNLTIRANAGQLDLAASLGASAGVLDNAGLLFAGNNLQAVANGKIVNTGTVRASDNDDAHTLQLTANTVLNKGEIDSGGAIRIVAATLSNGNPALLTREWHDNFWAQRGTAGQVGGQYDDGGDGGNEDQAQDWVFGYTRWQAFAPGVVLPTIAPQITGKDVTLYFTQGHNIGGVIQGTRSATMQGFSRDAAQGDLALHQAAGLFDGRNGFQLTGATFTNDSLQLLTEHHTVNFTTTRKLTARGPAEEYGWNLCVKGSSYYDSICHNKHGYANNTFHTTASNSTAGIYAGTLAADGFTLNNNGATAPYTDAQRTGTVPAAAPVARPDAMGVGAANLDRAPGATPGASRTKTTVAAATPVSAISYLSANRANGVDGTSFGGINITLPSSPNGLFVVSRAPSANYLVESNPLYTSGSSAFGSDYLARLLGYDPGQLSMRLGDAGYEAWLVKQQLVKQAGMAVMARYATAEAQMQGMMESAATQKTALKLEFGKALTPEQQAALKHDIVWMVQTEIDGKIVLAPVVYLAQSTKTKLAQGAVISAQDANLSLTSLTNTGGTIAGGSSLVIASTGDITNLSGLIQGGNVSLTSTEGSIVNRTASSGNGTEQFFATDIGKTASIQATGALALDARKDIANIGAGISAGTDASLKAGGNITFDTIENKTANTTSQESQKGFVRDSSSTTVTSVQQIKSGLTVGGNLTAQAGNDITLAGTDANIGGNADLQAGNNLNIVARENTTTTTTNSSSKGLGKDGAIYASTDSTTTSLSVRNVGSTLAVGGNASLAAKNDITIQGSDVTVKGSGSVSATNVHILAGRNYDETTTTTTSTAVGKVMDKDSTGAGKTNRETASSSKDGKAQASAGGSAEAGNTSSGGVALHTKTTTTETETDLRHVGSNLSFGGDLSINATKDVNLQGSKVAAQGNVEVTAINVNLLAAEDKKTHTVTTSTTSVGFLGNSENKSDASGKAAASAYGGKGAPNAKAGVEVGANASSDSKLALYQGSKSSETTIDATHQASSIQSGGSMTITASENLTVRGSDLASGGDMALKATDMRFEAVHDTHTTTKSSETTSVGLYASGSANAGANAKGNAGIGALASGSASASVKGEAGLYGEHNKSGSVEGSTTARTSSITSGGNLTRTASSSITDVGTRADVKGDLTQSAKTITSLAAENTTFSSSRNEDIGVKVGAYGEAGVTAQGQAGVGPKPGGQAFVAPGVGGGIRASGQYEKSSESATSSTVVVSTFKVGGSVTSTSTGATKMEGTQIEAGKNVTLNAGSLEYTAARDTTTAQSSSVSGGGSVAVDLVNKAGSASGSGGKETSTERTSTAVVGGIKAGGGISVNVQGDARFEGTQIESGGSTTVQAGGSLRFDAAKNTSESTSTSVSAGASVSAGKKEGSGSVEVGYEKSTSSSSKDVVASIKSGGGVTTKSGGDTTLVGTNLAGQGDVNVQAGGNLNVEAGRETRSEKTVTVDASGAGGKQGVTGKKYASTGEANVTVSVDKKDSDTRTGATITSAGGNVNLSSGKNTTLEGTQVQAQGQATVAAGGGVTQKAAISTSSSSSVDVSASASGGSMQPAKKGGTTTTGAGGKKNDGPIGSGILEVETTRKSTTSAQEVSVKDGQGMVISEGGSTSALRFTASVPIPTEGRKVGRGAAVVATTSDGKPLPSWLKFDAKTGSFSGVAPEGYKGDLKVNVSIPMADGTKQTRTVTFGQ